MAIDRDNAEIVKLLLSREEININAPYILKVNFYKIWTINHFNEINIYKIQLDLKI